MLLLPQPAPAIHSKKYLLPADIFFPHPKDSTALSKRLQSKDQKSDFAQSDVHRKDYSPSGNEADSLQSQHDPYPRSHCALPPAAGHQTELPGQKDTETLD